MRNNPRVRKQKGAGIATIGVFLFAIILGSVGLFSFEMMRHNTCYDELRSACEAAALAGAAAMASSDNMNTATTRANARTAAQEAFQRNSIVGVTLNPTDTTSMTAGNYATYAPAPDKSAILIEFVDPATGTVITDDNSPNGRVVRVSAAFSNQPLFGKFLGIPSVPMRTRADSSVPQLDVVMCFDVSGSMDNQTPVTKVARVTGGSPNKYVDKGHGTLDQVLPGDSGSDGASYNNAFPPECCSWDPSLNWDQNARGTGSKNDALPANAADNGSRWTDVVVNIDGNSTFGGTTITVAGNSYNFPNVGTLVEAARGNLENAAIASSSGAASSLPGVTPQAGYQAAYFQAAFNNLQPIAKARDAAIKFFQIMNNNTDAHFGFVSFSSKEYHQLTDTVNGGRAIDDSNGYGPATPVPSPGIQLSQTADNFTSCISAIVPKMQAYSGTNFGDSLSQAVAQLQDASKFRAGAKKAIVFFTDGHPSPGTPDWHPAAALCQTPPAGQSPIQIYTVGLAQTSAMVPIEVTQLNAGAGIPVNYTDPVTGNPGVQTPGSDGMAKCGGSGGKFFLVSNADNLRYVFENIARNLVQLVKG